MSDDYVGMKQQRHTDLLIGMVSCCGEGHNQSHYFLADLDIKDRRKVDRIAMKLVQKYRTGNIYIVKSGKGYHLLSFSNPVSLNQYVRMLRFVEADSMFVRWVRKVGYGVLRISRRSSHMQVPCIVGMVVSPFTAKENIMMRAFYLSLLGYEEKINKVRRLLIEYVS